MTSLFSLPLVSDLLGEVRVGVGFDPGQLVMAIVTSALQNFAVNAATLLAFSAAGWIVARLVRRTVRRLR